MKISSDFAGGNIIYKGCTEENDFTEVFLEQDLRDTDRWWFYWNFRVDSPPKGRVRFSFCNGKVVCPYGAAVSENGFDWHYDTDGYEDATHFSYTFDGSGKSVYFAFTLPYQVEHFEKFYKAISDDNRVERKTFCLSEQGRDVPLLVFGSGEKDVVFTARHHCCESTASYALEGVVSALLNDRAELLKKYRFHVVPFIDIDGAENGDQGKARIPHDHNRDYTDKPIYNSVKAMCTYAKMLNVECFIDFHSPWRWGGADSRPHIHLTSFAAEPNKFEDVFVEALKEITEKDGFDGIKYDGYVTHLGDSVNPPNSPDSNNYFINKVGAKASFAIETPYSGDLPMPYSASFLHEWGENIAEAFYKTFG